MRSSTGSFSPRGRQGTFRGLKRMQRWRQHVVRGFPRGHQRGLARAWGAAHEHPENRLFCCPASRSPSQPPLQPVRDVGYPSLTELGDGRLQWPAALPRQSIFQARAWPRRVSWPRRTPCLPRARRDRPAARWETAWRVVQTLPLTRPSFSGSSEPCPAVRALLLREGSCLRPEPRALFQLRRGILTRSPHRPARAQHHRLVCASEKNQQNV